MAMSLSLETRLPFLDHEIAEYVYGLPTAQFFGRGHNKHFLRAAAHAVLPDHINNQKIKFQRPGDNGRLIFGSLKTAMLQGIGTDQKAATPLLSSDAHAAFASDCCHSKNGKYWFRAYLALRWQDIIRKRKATYAITSAPEKAA